MIRDFLSAIRFLTVFPLSSDPSTKPDTLARSMLFFPAVGLLIGALSVGFFMIAQSFLPPRVAVLALLVAPILISGGLHVDGFADFCDGFFGGKDKSGILRIMKDSRIGAWGALGIALLVLIKFELLQTLPDRTVIFLLAMAASRWAQVVLSFFLPYAGSENGMGNLVAGKVLIRELSGATLFLLFAVLAAGKRGLIIFTVLLAFLFLLGLFFKNRVGGVTGDLLGAASELTEVFIFLTATLGARSYE